MFFLCCVSFCGVFYMPCELLWCARVIGGQQVKPSLCRGPSTEVGQITCILQGKICVIFALSTRIKLTHDHTTVSPHTQPRHPRTHMQTLTHTHTHLYTGTHKRPPTPEDVHTTQLGFLHKCIHHVVRV